MIRVLLLADTRVYRDSLGAQLAGEREISLLACAGSGPGVGAASDLRPDVVLVDLASLDAIAAVRAILAVTPGTKIVAIGLPETEQFIVACAEAGVSGYVARDGALDEVIATIRSVMRGEAPCSPRITAILLRRLAMVAADHEPRRGSLTHREQQILELIEQGRSNKEIALTLCIEVTTVKNHVHKILEKLHVRRRAEAAAWMRRSAERPSAS